MPRKKKQNIKEQVIEMILVGNKKPTEIISWIIGETRWTLDDSRAVYRECKEEIKVEIQKIVPILVNEHVDRYEELYDKFVEIDRTDLINELLKQKEDLLGMQSEAMKITLKKREEAIEVEQKKKMDFDFSNLNKFEKERFKQLLKKLSYESRGA